MTFLNPNFVVVLQGQTCIANLLSTRERGTCFWRKVIGEYKALLCVVAPGRRSSLLKVIVPLAVVIKAIITSGVASGEKFILFGSSIKSCPYFCKATISCQMVTSALGFFNYFNTGSSSMNSIPFLFLRPIMGHLWPDIAHKKGFCDVLDMVFMLFHRRACFSSLP